MRGGVLVSRRLETPNRVRIASKSKKEPAATSSDGADARRRPKTAAATALYKTQAPELDERVPEVDAWY